MRHAGYFTANVRDASGRVAFNGSGKTDWNFTYAGQPFESDTWDDLKTTSRSSPRSTSRRRTGSFMRPRGRSGQGGIPPYYPDHPVTARTGRKYLDAATELDRKIGMILEQLEADGLAGQHHRHLLRRQRPAHVRGKQFCYDSGLHVPLIIRWPKNLPRRSTSSRARWTSA